MYKYLYFIKKNINSADTETIYDIANNIYYDYNKNFNNKEIFYFIDNGNLTGVNVSFPTISHFLITTHNKSLIRDIQQGMFRLRLLDYTHTIDIIYYDNSNNKNASNNSDKNICYYQNKWIDNELMKNIQTETLLRYYYEFSMYKKLNNNTNSAHKLKIFTEKNE